MLLGRQYELNTATVAIDANRVAVKIPAGSLVRVVSDASTNDRMVDVLWESRPYTVFVTDLVERGNPVNELTACDTPNSVPDAEKQALRQALKLAHERRQRAYVLFREVMADIPSGLPHPDGTDRIRQASNQLEHAQREVIEALARLDKFLTDERNAAEMERMPVDSQTGRDLSKKVGAG